MSGGTLFTGGHYSLRQRRYGELQQMEYIAGPSSSMRLFAPTQGLHFQTLHPLSFLFICTLHCCKHCTGKNVASNLRNFPLTALCGIAADGVVCMPVLVCAFFAPTQGLHFQALRPLGFLFICTLHWCKHCTGLDVAPNLRKFSMTVLCGIAADEVPR